MQQVTDANQPATPPHEPGIAGAQSEVRLSYLGTAGWEITDGKTVILVDPCLSRLDPPLVLPTHWDRFNVPYSISQQPAVERLQFFLAEVNKASPSNRVIVPEYFQPIVVKANQNRPAQNK
jgi:L-ascorbate metabolism protein UlaG (beta-lactamase superfamily)